MRPSRLFPLLALIAALPGLLAHPSAAALQQSTCPGCTISGGTAFGDGFCDNGTYAWVLTEITARRGRCRLITGPYPICIPNENCSIRARTEVCATDPSFGDMCFTLFESRSLVCGEDATFSTSGDCGATASITVLCTPCAE